MKLLLTFVFGIVLFSIPVGVTSQVLRGQDKEKPVKVIPAKVVTPIVSTLVEHKNPPDVPDAFLSMKVPKDVKIFVNDKAISYEKFAVLMEFAQASFTIEEILYKEGKFTSLKLVSK